MELEVTITLLEESHMRTQALQLLDRLGSEINGLCADWHLMSGFWHGYGEILGRSSLAEGEIRRGLDMFQYWTEGEAWRKLAWGLREEVQEMLEVCRGHIRHRRRSVGHE